jgi:hypothetical protein
MAAFIPPRTEQTKTVLDVLLERLVLEHYESLATAGRPTVQQPSSAGYVLLLGFLGFLLLFFFPSFFFFFHLPLPCTRSRFLLLMPRGG